MAANVVAEADVEGLVASAVERALYSGGEIGVQVAAVVRGRLVVDVRGGLADVETRKPVDSETLFSVFSASKGVVSTLLLRAVETGLLELDEPIADHWPAFAAHGKASARVVDLLTHSVGVPQMPRPCSVEQMCDWDQMVRTVGELEPLWSPGAATGYHAYTFGWIAGRLLAPSAGSPASEQLAQTLGDAGLEGFWFGLPEDRLADVATLYDRRPPAAAAPQGLLRLAMPDQLRPQPGVFNRADVRRACLPAMGGIGTARALAELYANLAASAVGVPYRNALVSPAMARAAATVRTDEVDRVLGVPIRKGLGFFVGGGSDAQAAAMGSAAAFGHPGAGGSVAWADPEHAAGVAIVKNSMSATDASGVVSLATAVREAVARIARIGA